MHSLYRRMPCQWPIRALRDAMVTQPGRCALSCFALIADPQWAGSLADKIRIQRSL